MENSGKSNSSVSFQDVIDARAGLTKEEIAKTFDVLADNGTYDTMTTISLNYVGHQVTAEAVSKLYDDIQRGKIKILDIAAGTGLLSGELRNYGFKNIDGVDPSERSKESAMKESLYDRYLVDFVDEHQLDIPSETYDCVTSSGGFAAGLMPCSAIKEFIRVAKIGALICFSVPDYIFTACEEYRDRFEPRLVQYEESGVWKRLIKTPEIMCEVGTFVKDFHNEEAVKEMKYNSLGNTGIKVSEISFGASPLAGVFMPTEEMESIKTVHQALKNGINFIDTAPWYGQGKSESVLGKALKNIPRESYYLATKVGRYELEWDKMFDFSAERTRKSFEESLERLGLDYIDVIQVHDMEFASDLDIIINETLPVLDEIRKSGKAKFIGITGYPLENYKKVLERSQVKIDVVLSYCHGAMYDDTITEIIPYLKNKGVGIINAAPIGMGLLSNRGPPTWHPAKQGTKQACQHAAQFCQDNEIDICKLAMKHSLNIEGVDTTIVGMERCDVVEKNLIIRKTDLTERERHVYNDVMNKFMKPLNNLNWEGIEVEHYRKKIAELENKKKQQH